MCLSQTAGGCRNRATTYSTLRRRRYELSEARLSRKQRKNRNRNSPEIVLQRMGLTRTTQKQEPQFPRNRTTKNGPHQWLGTGAATLLAKHEYCVFHIDLSVRGRRAGQATVRSRWCQKSIYNGLKIRSYVNTSVARKKSFQVFGRWRARGHARNLHFCTRS